MYGKLRAVDIESGSRYSREYPPSRLREVVEASLANINETRGRVSEQNLQRLLRAMGNIRRDAARTVRVQLTTGGLMKLSTRDLPARSSALSSFMHEATVFYDSESLKIAVVKPDWPEVLKRIRPQCRSSRSQRRRHSYLAK
jgi:hypothetical protein